MWLMDYFELETSVTVRHANDRHRLFEPRQTVAVEKDSFNIVPQDYIINCQWKLKTVKTLTNLGKD